jgi:hypothetical protein
MRMRRNDFFATHALFTLQTLRRGGKNPKTIQTYPIAVNSFAASCTKTFEDQIESRTR